MEKFQNNTNNGIEYLGKNKIYLAYIFNYKQFTYQEKKRTFYFPTRLCTYFAYTHRRVIYI